MNKSLSEHIEVNPEVMLGKPVIKGTRIPVEIILRKLGEGITEKDLLEAYPRLTRDGVRAAMIYAAEVIAHDEVIIPASNRPRKNHIGDTVSS